MGGRFDSTHIYPWHQVEVTLGRGKQAQVIIRQEAGWEREAVLKLQRKENSLSLAWNQTSIPR